MVGKEPRGWSSNSSFRIRILMLLCLRELACFRVGLCAGTKWRDKQHPPECLGVRYPQILPEWTFFPLIRRGLPCAADQKLCMNLSFLYPSILLQMPLGLTMSRLIHKTGRKGRGQNLSETAMKKASSYTMKLLSSVQERPSLCLWADCSPEKL